MSNKSPFEIRLEILQLTADLMKAEYEANVEFAQETLNNLIEKGLATFTNAMDYSPKPFNFAEVLDKSKQFYDFVNSK